MESLCVLSTQHTISICRRQPIYFLLFGRCANAVFDYPILNSWTCWIHLFCCAEASNTSFQDSNTSRPSLFNCKTWTILRMFDWHHAIQNDKRAFVLTIHTTTHNFKFWHKQDCITSTTDILTHNFKFWHNKQTETLRTNTRKHKTTSNITNSKSTTHKHNR